MEEAKRRGLELDVWSYSTLIKGLCQAERSREAEEVLLAMKAQGVQPNVVSIKSVPVHTLFCCRTMRMHVSPCAAAASRLPCVLPFMKN